MKYQIFQFELPTTSDTAELNTFLSSHRATAVSHYIVRSHDAPLLVFVVEYVDGQPSSTRLKGSKPDPQASLSDSQSVVFNRLRDWRKRVSSEAGLPVYNIINNAQLVHHAIIRVTGPVFERGAMDTSYACRRGLGQHAALSQARRWTGLDGWFLKLDVAKFYDTIDHARLRHLLQRRFRERRLLDLFDRLLASYATASDKGLPIGALTSQYLGNFYLDVVDRWVKQTMGVRRYVRYMDDMLLWGTKDQLRSVLDGIEPYLESVGLGLNPSFQLNRCELGIPFLGFVVYPNRIRLNASGRKRLRQRHKGLERGYLSGEVSEDDLQARSRSLFAHASFADDINWRRSVCGFSLVDELL